MSEVLVYSKENCMQCKMTKRLLDKQETPYTAIEDADQEPIRTQLYEEGFCSFPVVKVENGESWAGFRPDLIKEIATQALLKAKEVEPDEEK